MKKSTIMMLKDEVPDTSSSLSPEDYSNYKKVSTA
jgi:hypothetical protein